MKLFKKAAMFGLDARIALAIFGALSVISGAALYSAIQDAKATALLSEMNEIGKAWESYLLDAGQDLPKGATGSGFTEYLNHPTYGLVTLVSTSKSDWGMGNAIANWSSAQCNDGNTPCYLTVQLSDLTGNVLTIQFIQAVDRKVDGGDGVDKGSIRWYESGSARSITYHYAPYKLPQ